MQRSALQRHRMNRTMNFARAHMEDSLSLDRLAAVACLSKYHFARVFQHHFGETPIEFRQRIRLERAAGQLAYTTGRSITDIALESGFASSQSFSRSFRSRFGMAPRSFKQSNQWNLRAFAEASPLGEELHIPKPGRLVPDCLKDRLRVEVRPAYRIAYIRHMGPFGDVKDSITETFCRLQWWAGRKGLLDDDTRYIGVCAGDCNLTPAKQCVYDAGVIVGDDTEEDEIVSIRTVPGGRFAVLYVECKPVELNSKWIWMVSSWLPSSRKTIASRPSYEFFAPPVGFPVRAEYGADLCLAVG